MPVEQQQQQKHWPYLVDRLVNLEQLVTRTLNLTEVNLKFLHARSLAVSSPARITYERKLQSERALWARATVEVRQSEIMLAEQTRVVPAAVPMAPADHWRVMEVKSLHVPWGC